MLLNLPLPINQRTALFSAKSAIFLNPFLISWFGRLGSVCLISRWKTGQMSLCRNQSDKMMRAMMMTMMWVVMMIMMMWVMMMSRMVRIRIAITMMNSNLPANQGGKWDKCLVPNWWQEVWWDKKQANVINNRWTSGTEAGEQIKCQCFAGNQFLSNYTPYVCNARQRKLWMSKINSISCDPALKDYFRMNRSLLPKMFMLNLTKHSWECLTIDIWWQLSFWRPIIWRRKKTKIGLSSLDLVTKFVFGWADELEVLFSTTGSGLDETN